LGCHLALQEQILAGNVVGAKLAGVEDSRSHKISVVYSPDVAECVIAVIKAGSTVFGEVSMRD
jgi:hypothetical protein